MSLTTDQKIALTAIAVNYIARPDVSGSVDYLNKHLPNVYLALESFVLSSEQEEPAKPETSSVGKLRL